MQVLCHPSDTNSDILCPVCKQGFRLFWERNDIELQEAALPGIFDELREHHSQNADAPHPETPFNIPTWSGLPQFSAAALLGGAA